MQRTLTINGTAVEVDGRSEFALDRATLDKRANDHLLLAIAGQLICHRCMQPELDAGI